MNDNKFKELIEEFRTVFSGRTNTADAVIPPLLFLIANGAFGFSIAMWVSLATAVIFLILRLIRKQKITYVIGGLAAVGLAIFLSIFTERAENYFLPTILTSAVLLVGCIISVFLNRPLASYASHLTRGWPLAWFRHPDVKPAYIEVTWIWAAFIALRLGIQIDLYQKQAASTLAWVNIATGWPVTIAVLVLSYIFGIWRLQKLKGPGVDEFINGKEPPWEGQRRGF